MATVADNLKQVPLPKNTFVVAQESGKLYILDFTEFPHLDDPDVIDWDLSVSKMIIGKIKQTRTSMLTLQEIECENVVHPVQTPTGAVGDFQMTIFGSLDGKNNTLAVNPYVQVDEEGYVKATCRLSASNFQVQLRGTFNVNTMVVTFARAGRR